jgi:hypothetical protein
LKKVEHDGKSHEHLDDNTLSLDASIESNRSNVNKHQMARPMFSVIDNMCTLQGISRARGWMTCSRATIFV